VIAHLRTDRLLLRGWTAADRAPFAALNADPEVMAHFPATLTRGQSDAMVDQVRAGLAERGWGLWAAELRESREFIGFVGLTPAPDDAPAAPATEIGWRIARPFWGRGLAPEAARAAADFGFTQAGLPELVSFTTAANTKSQRVMQKIGMTRDPAEDFVNTRIPGWARAPHVIYRLSAESA
jgi:ribosomal-protein-alanine N-acetyltransferase